mmetsp:Transcript_17512/g.40226  ORF Transcript_17512/g.40226 Transcript_17512/m.40226 type:complete len:335 (+) Transcript_17512:120-1124(+)
MLSSTLRRRATSVVGAANRAAQATASSGTTATASSVSSAVPSARHSSSAPQTEDQSDSSQEFVSVLKLNMLQQNPGAVKKKRRVGRGIGSSKGKTSGRGHKGTKARAGGSVPLTFEGGQTPFYKLLPKRGFTNKRHKADMVSLNIGTLQDYIDMGRLPVDKTNDDSVPVWNMKDLLDAGMFTTSSVKSGIKLLAEGKERLKTPFKLEISRASESAIDAVEAIGGEVTTVHYNRLALRALLKPHKFTAGDMTATDDEGGYGFQSEDVVVRNNSKTPKALPKFARPPPKWQPYYTNWNNRGYLSVQAQMRKLLAERPELEEKFTQALANAKGDKKE